MSVQPRLHAGSEQEKELIPLHDVPENAPRPHRIRRALLAVLVLTGIVAGAAAGFGLYMSETFGNNVSRIPDVFGSLDPNLRPAATGSLTFLLVGTDSRSPEPTTGDEAQAPAYEPGAQRSDVIMLVTFEPDRQHASVVSIPRDSWVPIPGRGMDKINAAYSFGGPPLLIDTVEQLTRLRVDHFMVIDFAGFQEMTDAVGGIDVFVSQATSNYGVEFRQGLNRLDGYQALAYVRQRYGLPNGDLDRVRRHQNALKALLDKAASNGLLTDPAQTYRFVDALTRSISVDDTLDNPAMRGLAFELRGIRTQRVSFVSVPVRGLGREGDQSVVYLNDTQQADLWAAVSTGRVADYLRSHPDDQLSTAPS